jgi:two-component system chemotaxis response regulator CheB
MNSKYRVLIFDESAFIRQYLSGIFNNSGELEVVAATGDPARARELIKNRDYDVITLDMAMKDGQAIIHELRQGSLKPVVLINSPTQNTETLTKAFLSNVVDFITKPPFGFKEGMKKLDEEIIIKVTAAAKVKLAPKTKTIEHHRPKTAEDIARAGKANSEKLIVIGASTGGTVALTQIFRELDFNLPGMIIIQHMPAQFTGAFAHSLDETGQMIVKEARDGDIITPGMAMIVPGGKSLTIRRLSGGLTVAIRTAEKEAVYSPSIDTTMHSAAIEAGPNAMGIILTGMGDDGARGLRAMYDQGAYTIAQDERTSLIYGMPKKAVEYGGVNKVLPLDELAGEMKRWGMNGGKNESANR